LSAAGIARLLLALVLVGAAGSKLLGGADARLALGTFGLSRPRPRAAVWAALVALELALAAALVAGVTWAPAAAAALFGVFAAALAAALAQGRRGAPCACFGRSSRVGPLAAVRAGALAVAAGAVPALERIRPSTTAWLAVGLCVALVGLLVLGVALLALARELGEVRLALGPQAALSIEGEGPDLGARVAAIDRFAPGARLALALFSSPGCRLCQALEPAIRAVSRDPRVSLRVFDEASDADVWEALSVPGSPFAVVLGRDGTALAKGTFNNLAQLEGLLAAAERVAAPAGA
jgi:hypothetical protein